MARQSGVDNPSGDRFDGWKSHRGQTHHTYTGRLELLERERSRERAGGRERAYGECERTVVW